MLGSVVTLCQRSTTISCLCLRGTFAVFAELATGFADYSLLPMRPSEIVSGIWSVGFGYVNAFVVAAERPVLVDAGIPKRAPQLREALERAAPGKSLGDVLVTHHHYDHIGSLDAIAGDGVTVWAHPLDAPVIRGGTPPRPDSRGVMDKIGAGIAGLIAPKGVAARVDREISEGEQIPIADGFVAYHTPGHTAGHVSFLYPSKRLLFVGDAAANMLGRLGSPFGLYSEDHQAVKRSIAKIAALDFDVACFGHGRVLKGDACARFRRLAEKLA